MHLQKSGAHMESQICLIYSSYLLQGIVTPGFTNHWRLLDSMHSSHSIAFTKLHFTV